MDSPKYDVAQLTDPFDEACSCLYLLIFTG